MDLLICSVLMLDTLSYNPSAHKLQPHAATLDKKRGDAVTLPALWRADWRLLGWWPNPSSHLTPQIVIESLCNTAKRSRKAA